MAVTFWTLVYGGTEKSFQDWGFTDPQLTLKSQTQSTFTVRVPGFANLVAAPPIPFEGAVTIYRNRTFGGGSYGGGEIVFQGRQVTRRSAANSQSPADTLIFGDAFYDLENLVFQQQWNYGAVLSTAYFSRLNLFQRYDLVTGISAATNGATTINITLAAPMSLTSGDYVTIVGLPGVNAPAVATVVDSTHINIPGQLTGVYAGSGASLWPDNQRISNGVQIQEIINFANAAGVAIQVGTIDLNYILPIYPVRAVSCASALQICMKPQPDAVSWIDYTTTPPTFNCRARNNLTVASLPYFDGAEHSTTEIVPRYDLVAPAVVIQYQKTSTVSGVTYEDFGTDAYPLLSTGRGVRQMVVPIDLRGANVQSLSILVQAAALPNLASGDAPSLAWWAKKKGEMAGYFSLSMVPGSLSVVDDNGNNLTSTWATTLPNEYLKGEILPWMGVNVVEVKVSAQFIYFEKDSAGRPTLTIGAAAPHTISVRVKLTNSPAGQKIYPAVQSADPGETAPAGLAQMIYNSLQTLNYEGAHTVIDPGFNTTSALIGPQNKLRITGGVTAWATMDAMIEEVAYEFFYNRAEIRFGPPKHIAPGDLEELLQFWRYRIVYDNPNLRVSGQQSQSQGSQVGGDTAAENTTHGNPQPAILALQSVLSGTFAGPGNSGMVKHDSEAQSIAIGSFDSSFAQISGTSSIALRIADIEPDDIARDAKFRLLGWKDASCNPWHAYIFMTDPEAG